MLANKILYLDVLFLINFIMDFILIWTTGRFTGLETSISKIFLAALIGALYSITVLFPALHTSFSSFLLKVFFSIIMIYIAFYPQNFRIVIRTLMHFYVIVFSAGGAMLAAIYLLASESTFMEPLKYSWLLAAIAVLMLIGRYGANLIKKNVLRSVIYVPVIIGFEDLQIPVKALIDTGNQLSDPITGKPVMVTELEVLRSIIPEKIYQELKKNKQIDINGTVQCLSETKLASRLRVIPFSSIGKQKGMLVGFRPDFITILHNEKMIEVKEIVIGIYNYRLSSKGDYKGILHPEILDMVIES